MTDYLYRTKLPESCPPSDAQLNPQLDLFRVTRDGKIDSSTFISQAESDYERYKNYCEGHAVSLCDTELRAKKIAKYLNKRLETFKFNEVTFVSIAPGIGKYLMGENGHCLLWIFKNTNIDTSVKVLKSVRY